MKSLKEEATAGPLRMTTGRRPNEVVSEAGELCVRHEKRLSPTQGTAYSVKHRRLKEGAIKSRQDEREREKNASSELRHTTTRHARAQSRTLGNGESEDDLSSEKGAAPRSRRTRGVSRAGKHVASIRGGSVERPRRRRSESRVRSPPLSGSMPRRRGRAVPARSSGRAKGTYQPHRRSDTRSPLVRPWPRPLVNPPQEGDGIPSSEESTTGVQLTEADDWFEKVLESLGVSEEDVVVKKEPDQNRGGAHRARRDRQSQVRAILTKTCSYGSVGRHLQELMLSLEGPMGDFMRLYCSTQPPPAVRPFLNRHGDVLPIHPESITTAGHIREPPMDESNSDGVELPILPGQAEAYGRADGSLALRRPEGSYSEPWQEEQRRRA